MSHSSLRDLQQALCPNQSVCPKRPPRPHNGLFSRALKARGTNPGKGEEPSPTSTTHTNTHTETTLGSHRPLPLSSRAGSYLRAVPGPRGERRGGSESGRPSPGNAAAPAPGAAPGPAHPSTHTSTHPSILPSHRPARAGRRRRRVWRASRGRKGSAPGRGACLQWEKWQGKQREQYGGTGAGTELRRGMGRERQQDPVWDLGDRGSCG